MDCNSTPKTSTSGNSHHQQNHHPSCSWSSTNCRPARQWQQHDLQIFLQVSLTKTPNLELQRGLDWRKLRILSIVHPWVQRTAKWLGQDQQPEQRLWCLPRGIATFWGYILLPGWVWRCDLRSILVNEALDHHNVAPQVCGQQYAAQLRAQQWLQHGRSKFQNVYDACCWQSPVGNEQL